MRIAHASVWGILVLPPYAQSPLVASHPLSPSCGCHVVAAFIILVACFAHCFVHCLVASSLAVSLFLVSCSLCLGCSLVSRRTPRPSSKPGTEHSHSLILEIPPLLAFGPFLYLLPCCRSSRAEPCNSRRRCLLVSSSSTSLTLWAFGSCRLKVTSTSSASTQLLPVCTLWLLMQRLSRAVCLCARTCHPRAKIHRSY